MPVGTDGASFASKDLNGEDPSLATADFTGSSTNLTQVLSPYVVARLEHSRRQWVRAFALVHPIQP